MNQGKQTLLPQITHDLRNYIGGISGLAEIMSKNLNDYLAKQEQQGIKPDEDLKEVHKCINALTPYSNEAMRYVDDLLNNTQMESRKYKRGT